MELVLDVAAELFAEAGYENTTTNAIASRAGMSPGSLYQYFANKEAIAEALAERYVAQLEPVHAATFQPELADLPLDELLDRVVDPLVAFNVDNPAAHALLHGADISEKLAARTCGLHDTVLAGTEAMLAARDPALPVEQRRRMAEVMFHTFKGLLPLTLAAEGPERDVLVGELKAVLRGYLAPVGER